MNASPITAIRTAAVSGRRDARAAREDARVLAIVGAGHQAHPHIAAMLEARPFERDPHRGAHASRTPSGSPPSGRSPARSTPIEEAVRGADVDLHRHAVRASRCSRREWLEPGAHINAVGACLPHARELDAATVARSSFFTDRRESCENEAGDYILALAGGRDRRTGHIRAELGEVLAGDGARADAREEEITVFESLGLAVEDLAAAEYLVRRARESRRRHDASSFDPARRDRARPRADRGRGGADAARPPARHGHLAEAGEPAAGRRRSRSAARRTRSGRRRRRSSPAASSPPAPGTWRRASPGRRARPASRRRSSSPTTRRRRSSTAIERARRPRDQGAVRAVVADDRRVALRGRRRAVRPPGRRTSS